MKILQITLLVTLFTSCRRLNSDTQSDTGISKTTANIAVGSDGLTTEQANVKRRLEQDNKPGAIKYAYCISAYSGEVIFQSTVKGKVTSSGKRLTPIKSFTGSDGISHYGPNKFGNIYSDENIQDDGTFGNSVEYIYWWDINGVYHQHYIVGGQIFIVRDQPMTVNRVTIDLNIQK